MGLAEWDLFLWKLHGTEFKIRPSSVFDSQYSIIPQFHHSTWCQRQTPPLRGEIKAGPVAA